MMLVKLPLRICVLFINLCLIPVKLNDHSERSRMKYFTVASMCSMFAMTLVTVFSELQMPVEDENITEFRVLIRIFHLIGTLYFYILNTAVFTESISNILLGVQNMQIKISKNTNTIKNLSLLFLLKFALIILAIGGNLTFLWIYGLSQLLDSSSGDIIKSLASLFIFLCSIPARSFTWMIMLNFGITSLCILEYVRNHALQDLSTEQAREVSFPFLPMVSGCTSGVSMVPQVSEESLTSLFINPPQNPYPSTSSSEIVFHPLVCWNLSHRRFYLARQLYFYIMKFFHLLVVTQFLRSSLYFLFNLSLPIENSAEFFLDIIATIFECTLSASPIVISMLEACVQQELYVKLKNHNYKTLNLKQRKCVRRCLETAKDNYPYSSLVLFEYDLELASDMMNTIVLISTNIFVRTEN